AATATMVCAARPGVRVSELLGAAASMVAGSGVTAPVGAVAGHGIGLELWERPLIKEHADPGEDVTLRAGMVLCLEPILAPPHPDGGLAGVFVIEQQVLLTYNGCEVLCAAGPPPLRRHAQPRPRPGLVRRRHRTAGRVRRLPRTGLDRPHRRAGPRGGRR